MAVSSGPPADSNPKNPHPTEKHKASSFLTEELYRGVVESLEQREVNIAVLVGRNSAEPAFSQASTHWEMNRSYADRWLAGERWKSILTDHDFAIKDGNHRVHAAILLGHKTIMAYIRPKPVFSTTHFPAPEAQMREHYRINIPYSSFVITVRDGMVVEVDPTAQWMAGKELKKVIEWVRCKHGTVAVIERNMEGALQ